MNKGLSFTALAGITLIAGCASTGPRSDSTPTASGNPPPKEAFAKFTAFELKPINTGEGCNKQHGANVALSEIQDRLDMRLGSVIVQWNTAGTKDGAPRKLIIEPVCKDVRLVGTAGRMWGGAFAGDSIIAMQVRYIDASTQETVAEPSFTQRASAIGAAWTFGATDRSMPMRIVDLITSYTTKNYLEAVGGPTGL